MAHVEPSPQRTVTESTPASSAWTLFTLRGVPVRADRSLLLLGALFGYFFAYDTLRFTVPGLGAGGVLALTVVCALLLFVSILAHEIGHMWTSLDRQIPVRSITLFLFGGVTESTREATRARDEFVIVGIGPFISLVLGAAFGLIATGTSGVPAIAAVAGLMGWTNIALAVFNIVPAYPLDGGRLLRSIFWGVTGKPHKATRWAARAGQVFAGLIMFEALYGSVMGGGTVFGGLWNIFIGFFLFRGATASHKRAQLRERMERVRVGDLMGTVPPVLPATMSLRDALEQVQQRPSLLWPVGDPLRGTLTIAQIDAVPDEQWDTTTVGDVAHDPTTSSVEVDAAFDDVLDLISDAPENMLVVTDRGRAVGLLTPSLLASA